MKHPEEYGFDDHDGALAALRQRLESMSLAELEQTQQDLLNDLNAIPRRRDAHDAKIAAAKKALDDSRLTAVLDREGAKDLEDRELVLDAEIAARQRFRIEAARIEFTEKEVGDRIRWLVANEQYKATSYIEPRWRVEQQKALEDLRQALARFFAIEVRLQHVPNPASIRLDQAFMNIFETAEGRISKLVVQKWSELQKEALDLYERDGMAKYAEREAIQQGREKVAAKYDHLQNQMNPDGKSIKQLIREEV